MSLVWIVLFNYITPFARSEEKLTPETRREGRFKRRGAKEHPRSHFRFARARYASYKDVSALNDKEMTNNRCQTQHDQNR